MDTDRHFRRLTSARNWRARQGERCCSTQSEPISISFRLSLKKNACSAPARRRVRRPGHRRCSGGTWRIQGHGAFKCALWPSLGERQGLGPSEISLGWQVHSRLAKSH